MALQRFGLVSPLLGLILSLVACMEVNLAMFTVHVIELCETAG